MWSGYWRNVAMDIGGARWKDTKLLMWMEVEACGFTAINSWIHALKTMIEHSRSVFHYPG